MASFSKPPVSVTDILNTIGDWILNFLFWWCDAKDEKHHLEKKNETVENKKITFLSIPICNFTCFFVQRRGHA